jgi:hypothetical protein
LILKTIQTNVRVAPEDRALIVAIAARLRGEPGFRERLAVLLNDQTAGPELNQRLGKLEEQVAWLQSGAIVVPRATPRPPIALPAKGTKPPGR